MTARTVQGMARVRSGQAPAWPLVSDRSVRRGLQGQASLRVYVDQARFTCARCPAVTVTLDAGGADTYTSRAIPGPIPPPRLCIFPFGRVVVEQVLTVKPGRVGCRHWIWGARETLAASAQDVRVVVTRGGEPIWRAGAAPRVGIESGLISLGKLCSAALALNLLKS